MPARALSFLLFLASAPAALGAPALGPRRVMHPGGLAALPEHAFGGRVRVKFHDGIHPSLDGPVFHDGGRLLLDLRGMPAGLAVTAAGPWWDGDAAWLDKVRRDAMADCRCELADLRSYVQVDVAGPYARVQAWLAALNASKDVEVAYPVGRLAPRPADLPPTTPSYVEGQTYLGAAPDGLGAALVRALPGGDGTGVEVTDMEVAWTDAHEDLEGCSGAQVPGVGTIDATLPYQDYAAHGTSVLSILLGRDNGYGVTGMAPGAGCHYSPEYTTEHGVDAPRAILRALQGGVLHEGDVLLLESQTGGPGWTDPNSDVGLVPTEWEPLVFDAVRQAVTAGVVVVAAAGNGYEDLDDPKFNHAFDRARADSGAIIVGAGAPPGTSDPARSRMDFSNHGARVDVQGWGDHVVAAGYGDLFHGGNDERQFYTREFAGTSSASPMVAGAVALLQAIQRAGGGMVVPPAEVRAVLVSTGTPQQGNLSEAIGPQPDVAAAVDAVVVCGNARRDRGEVCDDGNQAADDGCSADCRSDETCGNGVVDRTRGEACDDANRDDADGCSADCRSDETCGNGVLDAARGEECDDGNRADMDGCNRQCRTFPPVVPAGCSHGAATGAWLLLLFAWRRRR